MNRTNNRFLLNQRGNWVLILIAFASTFPGSAFCFAQDELREENAIGSSDLYENRLRYESVINELVDVEVQILELQNSDAQRAFKEVESTLVALQAKRQRLEELERQWKLLAEGEPAIEIEPRLNLTTQSEQQLLIELEGSKEQVLRYKVNLLRLRSEFGPGHPKILDTEKNLTELDSVVQEQTDVLENLGVEVTSSVAKQRLQSALLRRAELKTKFGSGHPRVTAIEAEVALLESEVGESTIALASHSAPSFELINANLELREAETKFGVGHPVFKSLKQKIDTLEKFAESTAASEAPVNKQELARRLEARIETLQNRILEDEAGLDSIRAKQAELKGFEENTQSLMKQRRELNGEITRLLPVLEPEAKVKAEDRTRLTQQLLSGIEALEFMGKHEEANRIREILSTLKDQ